jgi:hypothetical protein
MKRALGWVAGAVLVIAACGGGSSAGAVKGQFVQQANQLCKKLADDYTAAKAALPQPTTVTDIQTVIRGQFVPEAITTYQQIGSMQLPTPDAEQISALMTAAIAEMRLIQDDPPNSGSPTNQRDLVRRFRELGLTECGAGFEHDLDKPQYLDAANTICSALGEKVVSSAKSFGIVAGTKPAVIAAFVQGTAVPLYRDAVKQLEGLGSPPGDEALLQALLKDWSADIDAVEQNPQLFLDVRRPAALDINKRWVDYGATRCGVKE